MSERRVISGREARELGLSKYFTGKPCKRGHVSERYVSGGCLECLHRPEEMEKRRTYGLNRWHNKAGVKERQRISDSKRWHNGNRKIWLAEWVKTPQGKASRRKSWQSETQKRIRKAWNSGPKGKANRNRRHKERIKSDVQYRLQNTLRKRVARAFKGNYKKGTALKLLGCTAEYLKFHMERQFVDGMSWDNMGKGEGRWNVDHVIPMSSFDLTDPIQAAEACNYKNLQPLWEKQNMAKKAKHPIEFARMNGMLL